MKRLIPIAVFLACWCTACSLPVPEPTLQPPPAPPPTTTSAPAFVLPTLTPTPTPASLTLRVGAEKINCRFGPGVVYASVNELDAGQPARVVGRNADATWWYIRDPGNPAGHCWVAAEVTQIAGDAESLPVIPPPLITVVKLKLRIEPPKIYAACDQFPQSVFFEAEVTADGPLAVTWRLESSAGYVSAENRLIFTEAGAQIVNGVYRVFAPGDHWIQFHALKPNDIAERLNFPANCAP